MPAKYMIFKSNIFKVFNLVNKYYYSYYHNKFDYILILFCQGLYVHILTSNLWKIFQKVFNFVKKK